MRLLIAAVFSVLVLQVTPVPATPVNKQYVRTNFVQKVEPPVVVPSPPTPQTQPEQTVVAPTTVEVQPTPIVSSDDHAGLMALAGITPDDYGYVDYIVSHESGWNAYATEPNSGAYGLCQSLPAEKMASAGSDWQSNPVTQLSWCNSYALSAYKSWYGAYDHWIASSWW